MNTSAIIKSIELLFTDGLNLKWKGIIIFFIWKKNRRKINLRWSLIKFCNFILRLNIFHFFFFLFFWENSQRKKRETFSTKMRRWDLKIKRCCIQWTSAAATFHYRLDFRSVFHFRNFIFLNRNSIRCLEKVKEKLCFFCWFRVEVKSSRIEFPRKVNDYKKEWRQHYMFYRK